MRFRSIPTLLLFAAAGAIGEATKAIKSSSDPDLPRAEGSKLATDRFVLYLPRLRGADGLTRPIKLRLSWQKADRFITAVHSTCKVGGLTHDFYRYPARFSPEFARAAIDVFSPLRGTVADPFMGGGTTLVEARVAGRHSIGSDISPLAAFIAKTKTQILSACELSAIHDWLDELPSSINLRVRPPTDPTWAQLGYHKHLDYRSTWQVRRFIELALSRLTEIIEPKQTNLARCVFLRTAQWALDGRNTIPSTSAIRRQLVAISDRMVRGAAEYSAAATAAQAVSGADQTLRTVCVNSSASRLPSHITRSGCAAPDLVLTSPPYPGVHILYHRWQLFGGKESAAPFWIANKLDGAGESHYLMHARSRNAEHYFTRLVDAFRPMAAIASKQTVFVQLVAFSNPAIQLPRYLAAMEQAGLRECVMSEHVDSRDGRLWRAIPNRRWHANLKGCLASSREVVLLHKMA